MKINAILFLLSSIIFMACSSSPKHPQAKLDSPAVETDRSILAFADSVKALQEGLYKQSSLIYQSAGQLFYVEKYSRNGQALYYTAHHINPGLSDKTTTYYIKNDSLLLIREEMKRSKDPGAVFEERRMYMRNNVPFKTEQRLATSFAQLQKSPFKEVSITAGAGYDAAAIDELKDALTGSNKYEMAFEELISDTEGQYISLKSKPAGNYTASVRVSTADGFIDSLRNMPAVFRNEKLNMRTEINANESVYVPVIRSDTSASGLKR